MSDVNIPDSQNDVISTATHVLYEFQQMVLGEMPNIAVVYDEELSYETSLKKIMNNDEYNSGSQDPLPFFSYNRSVMRRLDDTGIGLRAKNSLACVRVGDQVLTYSVAYGEFDLTFLYATKQIELMEKFEIVYNSDVGITGTKEITVDMADLGEFKYYLTYEDLQEKSIISDENYYKGLIGTIKVRGFYFTFHGTSGIINEINSRIILSRDVPNKEINEIVCDDTIS